MIPKGNSGLGPARRRRYVPAEVEGEPDSLTGAATPHEGDEAPLIGGEPVVPTGEGQGVSDAEEVDGDADGNAYDPGEHTAPEVLEYLETASDEERDRVLAAEKAGKARKTVLAED